MLLTKIFDFLASIKLAVIVILGLAVVSAVGTVVEARYDAEVAQKLVYHSPWMLAVLGLLCVNLIAVMVDRWPWKRHHSGFVLAHIGIIIMLVGSVFTAKYGVDGSMAFDIGGSNRYVTVPEQEFSVYSSFTGDRVAEISRKRVDFFLDRPSEESPYSVNVGADSLDVVKYHHYGLRKEEVVEVDVARAGPGIRFQLQNANVNLSEWLIKPSKKQQESVNLGPARVVLSDGTYKYNSGNEIVLTPHPEKRGLNYEIYTKSKGGRTAKGYVEAGSSLQTGWMGLTFRLLRYLPKADRKISYTESEYPNKLTHPAALLKFRGEDHWVALNSVLRLYDSDKMYIVTFGNRRIDLNFAMKLTDFRVGKYQGTQRAATYESDVYVPELGTVNISMNEPLKHAGYTFYQASFESDDMGRPSRSILSVNYDPGRGLKYLGSALMVLGTILLFYFKKTLRGRPKAKPTPQKVKAS
ncbi:MAG: cytochrome c biogenesis protein ResB [Bdellovibrionales bacterium]|nr:cytochrome c biogenesis protein ResB [Bdellovibrionales bacterium]